MVPRYSIGTMMGAILVCGLVLSALAAPSISWTAALFLLFLVLPLRAASGVRTSRGRGRAFRYGFLLGTIGYFLIAAGPWFPMMRAQDESLRGRLGYSWDEWAYLTWIAHLLLSLLSGALLGAAGWALASPTTEPQR